MAGAARRVALGLAASLAIAPAPGGALAAAHGNTRDSRQGTAMRVTMREVVLYPYDDVAAAVAGLQGRVVQDQAPKPIVMDDLASYRIEVEQAQVRLSADDMTRLMDRHVLPSAKTPIKDVKVSFGENQITMSGTMVKLGLPVPFTATATLAPTPAGDLRVHIVSMKAAGVIPKGLIDALGLPLSVLAQPRDRGVFHIVGDDLIVPLASMFPPPRFAGRLTAVSVTPGGLAVTVGNPGPAGAVDAEGKSFIHFRGGVLHFARLTMQDTDMLMVPQDAGAALSFSPAHYYEQLEGGYSKSLPDGALAAHVKNFR